MKTKILSILALLLTVTQGAWAQTTADIGRVIAADGKMYKTVTLANKVSLALSHADAAAGYTFNEYTATAGTLSGTTLTMSDANVTINATWTENTATLTDGDDLSALSEYAGKTCYVTYTRSFTADKPSTVCLPFAYTKKDGDGSFYEFTGIKKDGNEYIATMTEPLPPTPPLFRGGESGGERQDTPRPWGGVGAGTETELMVQ